MSSHFLVVNSTCCEIAIKEKILKYRVLSPNNISRTIHKRFRIHKLTSLSLHAMNIPRVFSHLIFQIKASFCVSKYSRSSALSSIGPCSHILLHQLLYSSPRDTIYRCNQLCAFTFVDYRLNCPFDLFIC